MNIRPWFTIGVVSWAPLRSVLNDQASDSLPIFFAVICFRGLKPEPSYVRRYISQSPGSGCWSRSSVTVAYGIDCACRPCVTRSATSRLHLNLMYDIVGFLSKVVRSYENLGSRCVVKLVQSLEKAFDAARVSRVSWSNLILPFSACSTPAYVCL